MKSLATLLALVGLSSTVQAVIVLSGVVDIPIPAATGPGGGLDGVYLDIQGVNSFTTPDDLFLASDVNFFLGGFAIRSSADFLPARADATATSPVLNILPGTPVNASLNFGPADIGTSNAHVGAGADQFNSGDEGFIAFALSDGGSPRQYGWMRVTLTNNGTGTIHEWAIQDTPGQTIIVGVPEPSSALLSLLGLSTLLLRRRR